MSFIKKYSAYLVFLAFILISLVFSLPDKALSDNHPCPPDEVPSMVNNWCVDSGGGGSNDGGGGDNDGGGGGNPAAGTLQNPIKSQTILEFIIKIIDVLLIFAVPIIVLFIMYAGFLFVTARGSDSQLTKAKSVLLWAIVGGVIALSAKLIIEVLQGTIEQF